MDLIDSSLYEGVVRITVRDSESLSIPDTGAGFTVVGDNASSVGVDLGLVAGGVFSVLLLALIIFKIIMRIRCRNTNDELNTRRFGKKFGLIVALVGFLVGSLSSFAGSSLGVQAAEPSVDVSITIDKTADFSGTSVVVPVEIKLREDYDYGYDLYAYMATDDNELKSDTTEDVINAVSSNGVALSGNTWGIVGGIATTPSADDSVWGMVGNSKDESTFLSKDLGDAKAGDTITVYLGVSIDASLPTGTYINKVAYYVYHPAVLDAAKASSSQCDEFFSISMRRELPDGFVANDSNTVSTAESRYPIYSFGDNRVLYFYTDAKRITVSPDTALDFSALNQCLVISGSGISNFVERFTRLADISGLSGWDMSRVTNMSNMFMGDIFLGRLDPLSGWDTSSVTDMSYMFAGNASLSDLDPLSGWDTSNVTNMESMFAGISSTSTANVSGINDWDIRNVTNFERMFSGVRSVPEFTKVSGSWDSDGTFTPCFNSRICDKPAPYIP